MCINTTPNVCDYYMDYYTNILFIYFMIQFPCTHVCIRTPAISIKREYGYDKYDIRLNLNHIYLAINIDIQFVCNSVSVKRFHTNKFQFHFIIFRDLNLTVFFSPREGPGG